MTEGILQFLYLIVAILFFASASGTKKIWGRAAIVIGVGTLLFHFAFLFERSVRAGRPPLTNMYETLHLLAFLTSLFFMVSRVRWRLELAGGFTALVSALLVASTAIASPDIEPLLPALKSNWLLFHVSACFIAYSSFALSMGCGLGYLIIQGVPFFKARGEGREELLRKADFLTHRFILFGYPFLTMGIALGAVWAELSWGRYWNWDPKETWAFSTWLVYSAYFHLRYLRRLPRVTFAWIAVFAFALVMFTYYGVNFWLSTLHDYA